MKKAVLWLAMAFTLAGVGAWIYGEYLSTPSQIKAAGAAFMRAAVSGDEVTIQGLLAPDSPMSATDIIELYKGHTFNNFSVYPIRALPNRSGVTWVANTSTLARSSPGYTGGTTLAFKQVNGRWLVYKAGSVSTAFYFSPFSAV